MFDTLVVNASPLILLAGVGQISLLNRMGRRVVVPEPVLREVNAHGPNDATVVALRDVNWIEVGSVVPIPPVIASWDLGVGETSVLAWAAANPPSRAVLDDRAARTRAGELGVPVVGTLGLVLAAKRSGVVQAATPLVERLRAAGMYVSEKLVRDSLRLVGE